MSRKRNKAMQRLLEAGYEVRVVLTDTDERGYAVSAHDPQWPTRFAEAPTLGAALEGLLKETGLDGAG